MKARSLLVPALFAACATTGAEGEGDKNLPTAGVGPFRKLENEEVKGVAPFVLDDKTALYREPTALRDGDATLLYAVARREDGADIIVRTRTLDGRTFYGASTHSGKKPRPVLSPDAPWEGTALSGPSAVRALGEVLLYYAAAGGVGLARSSDGLTFRKEPGPVFARDPAAAWETTELRGPSVFVLPDGRLRMLYTSGVAIGEAESQDGVHWRRVSTAPVLGPAPIPDPSTLLPNEKPPFDTAAVSDPYVATRQTPAGRLHVRVLYTGTNTAGATAIGFAARYGEDGALSRQPVPVYVAVLRGTKGPSAPAFVDGPAGEGAFLFVQQERVSGTGTSTQPPYAAIAAGFAPANVTLPPPGDFPEEP
jgi:hypothetical protein